MVNGRWIMEGYALSSIMYHFAVHASATVGSVLGNFDLCFMDLRRGHNENL